MFFNQESPDVKLHSVFDFKISDESAPLLPDPEDPSVQIWRDYCGKECAYAYETSKDYWLHFAGTATYKIDRSSNSICGYPDSFSTHERVLDLYTRIVLPIALHIHGTQVLHASAILTRFGVAAFCAMSETGKSTIAFALSQRGYHQWADDAVPFKIRNRRVDALPFIFDRRIHSKTAAHLGLKGKVIDHENHSEPVPLSILFVLHRMNETQTEPIKIHRLSPPQAFRSVLLHAHFFNLNSTELKKAMLASYMDLTSLVPAVEIHFQPGFDKLPVLLDEIERNLESTLAGIK
jgi:hypothetical protein